MFIARVDNLTISNLLSALVIQFKPKTSRTKTWVKLLQLLLSPCRALRPYLKNLLQLRRPASLRVRRRLERSFLDNDDYCCGKQVRVILLGFQRPEELEFSFQKRSEVCGKGCVVVVVFEEVCFQTYHVLVHVRHACREWILVWEQEKWMLPTVLCNTWQE